MFLRKRTPEEGWKVGIAWPTMTSLSPTYVVAWASIGAGGHRKGVMDTSGHWWKSSLPNPAVEVLLPSPPPCQEGCGTGQGGP